MELTEFTFRLVLLFLPGVVAVVIVEWLTTSRMTKLYRVIIFALMLGIVCYLAYYALTLIPFLKWRFTFLASISDKSVLLDYREILIAVLLSVPIALITSFLVNRGVLHGVARALGATRMASTPDVWGYLLNRRDVDWLVVRDLEYDRTYMGRAAAYSPLGDERELLLLDARVYVSSTGALLYKTPFLYLARKKDGFVMESPQPPAECGEAASPKKEST